MDEKGDFDKADDVLLPGFRFHPTDEELVGFYLKRKIQHRPLPIELIKQVDIYKYDPWDLPKLATTGEKEWYFYCPRDRKYRNSTRPNRVTRAGFWKATGTDRPIYSSEGSKCIGLKKSLVFYRGRAAKGIKTDWMMHEFRLPSASDPVQPKKLLDKNLPANDSWAICRIFKKANTMAQRALSHSWITPPPATVDSTVFPNDALCTQFSPETISYTSDGRSLIQLCCTGSSNDLQQVSSAQYPSFYKPTDAASSNRPSQLPIPNGDLSAGGSHLFLPHEMPAPGKCSADVASMMLNMPPALAEDIARLSESINIEAPHQQQQQQQQQSNTCSINLLQGGMEAEELSEVMRKFSGGNPAAYNNNKHLGGNGRSIGFPFSLPNTVSEAWKPNLLWESLSPSPSDMSPSFSTNKCFT